MIDNPPSYPKPFTFSGLLLSTVMTASIICGVIGGLAVLFFADGLFDVGPDPALPAAQVERQLAQTDQRLQHLENMQPAKANTPAELAALQKNLAQNAQQTQQLERKVQTLSASKEQTNNAAQIALGLTQIQTAYQNDLPMATGIQTLKNAVTSIPLQKTLDELATTTSQNFPSKKELLADVEVMKASWGTPAAPADPRGLTWDQRAKRQLGKFVTVQPQQVTAEKSLLAQTEESIRNNDFTTALATLQKLPETTEQKIFYKKIELRARAEGMINKVINDVTQKIGLGSQGALY